MTVQGIDSPNVEVETVFECSRENLDKCRARAQRILLQPRIKDGRMNVKLKRTPRGRLHGIKAKMLVRVPQDRILDVNVRGGGVYVAGMRSHVEVDAAAGDVDLLHTQELIGSVKVDVTVGSADLWTGGSRIKGHGFPRTLRWYGSGEATVNVDVGTGDVAVRLE